MCPIHSNLLVFICWTISGTDCKPLQQQSNDGLSIDDRLPITDIYDYAALSDAVSKDRSRNGNNLEKLTRTMDALTQFRRMIDHRLLTTYQLSATGNDQEGFDIQRRNSFMADETVGIPRTSAQQRGYHHRKHQEQAATRPSHREQRRDQDGNTYRIQGLNVKARLQQESSPSTTREGSHRGQDEPEQRFLTSRTTAMDEQQLRVFSDLAQAELECPRVQGKTTQVLCPSRRRHGYRVCIPDTALCNDQIDCPNGEDEEPVNCLFYRTTIHHFRLVVDAVVELSDLVKEQERRRSLDEL